MATKNGNIISGGSTSSWNAYRWYSQLEVTTKSETSTSITYTVKVKYYTQYAINTYANASLSGGVTGSWSGSMYSSSQSGRTVTVITKTDTVSKGSSSKTVSYMAKVQTTGGFAPGTSTATLSMTVPAIDYDAPNAPSACSASRVTDKQAKVTWTNGSTSTTKPRSSTKVERQTDSGSWAQIASVGNSVKNYTDNGISANHRYRYRVRAYGSGGYSGYSTSGYIYTTPKAPSAVSLVKLSDTQVQVSISGAAAWADGYELQRSVDSGSWAAVATVTAWPYTDTPGGGYVRYRVRAKRGTLASTWTESVEIATITPPLAPAVSLDPSGAVLPCGTAVTVAWSPNHPDGSEQSAAQVEYTVGSTAAQTVDVSGSATSYQLPEAALASPATVSVRVRTKGLDPDWGAWSSPVQVVLAYPPSVAITSPGSDGAVVDSLPLEVTWTVDDSTGVSSQTFELYGPDGLAYTAQLSTNARSITLDSSTYRLDNLTDYTVRLSVTGGSSLSTVEERSFETDYLEPAFPEPEVGVQYDDLSVSLEMRAGEFVPNLWVNPKGTTNGVTATSSDDGSLTVAGTNTTQITTYISAQCYALRDGATYTASIDKKPVGVSLFADYYNEDGYVGNVFMFSQSNITDVTFTADFSEATKVSCFVSVGPGVTVSGTYRVMLNEGTEPAPWQPPGYVLPATEYFTVERQNDDGTRWLVGDGLAEGDSCIDPLPPLNVDVHYLVTAHAASGTTATSDATVRVESTGFAYNFGADASECVIFRYDPSWSTDYGKSFDLYHFADGGETGGKPVAYASQDVDVTSQQSFRLVTAEEIRAADSLARRVLRGWVRDFYGGRAYGVIEFSLSAEVPYTLGTVDIDFSECVFEEAANGS